MPLQPDAKGRLSASGENLMAQYWELYLKLFKLTTDQLPPDQHREIKLALYAGMGFMVECISSGEIRRRLEAMEHDEGESFARCIEGLLTELSDFMTKEVPTLTLRAEIHKASLL